MSADRLTGIAFPFRIENGRVARSAGDDKVREDLRHLLSVRLGERAMLRAYGGGAYRHRQEPNDAALAALVRHEIEDSLRTFMPEIRLVAPLEVSARESTLTVVLLYTASPADVLRRLEVVIP